MGDKGHVKPPCPGGKYYTVKSGDTMFLIAEQFGICLQQLIEANPQIKNPDLIFPGQVLCIPKAGIPYPKPAPEKPCPNGFIYVVKPGDTLKSISHMFGVKEADILAANPQITDPHQICPGQRICIPVLPYAMPRCRCFTMYPTYHCSHAMGMGMICMEKGDLWVVAKDLPDPRHYGCDHMVLMYRHDDMDDFHNLEMKPLSNNTMMCYHRDIYMKPDPVFLIGAARRFPFAFGPLFLVAIIRL